MLIQILQDQPYSLPKWVTIGSDDATEQGYIENSESDDKVIRVRYKDLINHDCYVRETGMNTWAINEGQLSGNEWIDVDLQVALETGLI